MIIDDLQEFDRYAGLNPLFPAVAEFLRTTDLNSLPTGITKIQGDDLYINVQDAPAKTRRQARFESHRRMLDIQIPLTDSEEYGWTPVGQLPQGAYDEAGDMTMHDPAAPQTSEDVTQTYFKLHPGQFAIFFPADGHAPAISSTGLHKAIIKVKA
ncbi:MAG: YhcH/YjgK/YiaL family protein [Bacteroidaceae bacterium]|nr:YhcH/YjgK/YiaL family protein [Bacteroidaceae bacterium]